uniref:Transporter n=1 Tax=Leptobrachium leishanense TaxID=445787 RepID=A0A8C5QLZ5_9ANUR
MASKHLKFSNCKVKMEKSRPMWDNPLQFVFACISYAVGLGNIWRFPYLCQMYGGGGFLIPYIIMLIVEGMPLLYLELAVGQHMRQGSIEAWKTISPYLNGVGIASIIVSFFLCIYYNVINAWAFWYLFHSFQNPLPWSICPLNGNKSAYVNECDKSSSTQHFWYRETLNVSSSISDNGTIQWEQAICLILAWFTVYFCIIRGTESAGKMEHLTNPKTWINAATQIFFSLGLGFGSLIAFASYNDHNNNCERHAIIVSLINSGTSIFASVVTFSIYGFKATFNYENCISKVILLLTNTFDLEEGYVNTNNLENMKIYLNETFHEEYSAILPSIANCSLENELSTAVQGTGLAFIVYTEAIKNMEVSQLWSVLYFLMLLTLGIGSMLGNTAAILTPLTDNKHVSKYLPKEAISGLLCLISCLIGLIFTMESGIYWFDVFNDYAATLSLLIIVFVEIIAICYVYGLRRFENDVEMMIGHKPNWYWKIMWSFASPVLIIGLFIFYVTDYIMTGTFEYKAWDATQGQVVTKNYPTHTLIIIGLLVGASVFCIPLGALVHFIKKKLRRSEAFMGTIQS